MFKPRPKQQEVLDYSGGLMGVSAVPGSGKTRTLSALVARLVATAPLDDDQEVLVVTLVNSAVDNFNRQVGEFIREYDLLPNVGYRVRTLHSLSNDIVRARPGLVGLSDDFTIVAEREANEILQDVVDTWVRNNPGAAAPFLTPDNQDNLNIYNRPWPDAVRDIAASFIRTAKDERRTPGDIFGLLERADHLLPLAGMCASIYADYQRGLAYRGAVDFQDLMRLALLALELDADYLARLQHKWPYILEDEAQDSSLLQQDILRLLVGDNGNWVRVGDPNQAIYETFTTANPHHLREFLDESGVQRRELPNSGRSTRSIIDLANYLIEWTLERHPEDSIRSRQPLTPPYIEPTPPDDPQPNPADDPANVHIIADNYSPGREVEVVVASIGRWIKQNPGRTAAVLVPRNQRGFEVVKALKAARVEYVEMLRSTSSTREVAGAISNVLHYLAEPVTARLLARTYEVWMRDSRDDPDAMAHIQNITGMLGKIRQVEDFIWPQSDDWLESVVPLADDPDLHEHLSAFRDLIRRWQEAAMLPVDQLILTVGADLFTNAADLATAYSIALYLRRAGATHPDWYLPDYTDELARVARNERRFLGLSDDDTGFDPDRHRGKVTVATMHSAKGLEWDRVYLLSVNNYDFPSAQPFDRYISEKWFVRDNLNLEAEALAQLESGLNDRPYSEGEASQAARIDYATERLRLLYVGITRARRELVITWNTGRKAEAQEAIPLVALRTFWEQRVPTK